jgi:serine/threonine protein kinase
MGYFGEITVCPNIFLLLEYCNNGTLSEWIQKGIPEAKVLKLFRETIEGMCYMNAKRTPLLTQRRCIVTSNLKIF